MRVLVVEDDREVAGYVAKVLAEAGHLAEIAGDGTEGLVMATSEAFDVLVVDRMLPRLDGLALVQALRASDCRVPVLILSALGEVTDRVKGLRAGGDDYLAKPFAAAELLARIEALARRPAGRAASETALRVGDLEIDLLTRSASRAGRRIELQPREFRLLEFLARNAGTVMTRAMLLEGVWDYNFDPQTNVIDVHISRLRRKIDRGADRPLIHTVRGAGYVIRDGDASP